MKQNGLSFKNEKLSDVIGFLPICSINPRHTNGFKDYYND